MSYKLSNNFTTFIYFNILRQAIIHFQKHETLCIQSWKRGFGLLVHRIQKQSQSIARIRNICQKCLWMFMFNVISINSHMFLQKFHSFCEYLKRFVQLGCRTWYNWILQLNCYSKTQFTHIYFTFKNTKYNWIIIMIIFRTVIVQHYK